MQFQLGAEDPADRLAALEAIDDSPDESHLPLVAERLELEEDPEVRAALDVLLPKLTIAFAEDDAGRVEAIESLAGNVSLAARATLNPLLTTTREVAETLPDDANVARILEPGRDIGRMEAYTLLSEAELVPPLIES